MRANKIHRGQFKRLIAAKKIYAVCTDRYDDCPELLKDIPNDLYLYDFPNGINGIKTEHEKEAWHRGLISFFESSGTWLNTEKTKGETNYGGSRFYFEVR